MRFYDVLMLDEIVFCLGHGLSELDEVKRLIDAAHERARDLLQEQHEAIERIALISAPDSTSGVLFPARKQP